MPDIAKFNFTGGELDPALHARADLVKYANGLATLRNFKLHPQGGVSNREGLEFLEETKDSSKASRLIPFEFGKDQAYVLEFGDLYMRVWQDGGVVLEPAVTITNITQANPALVSAVNTYSDGDEVFIGSVAGMTELNGNRYVLSNVTGTTFELVGADSGLMTAYDSGGQALRIFTLVTPYTEAQLPLLKYTQSADIMTICHPSHSERDLSRTGHDAWSLDEITYVSAVTPPTLSGVAAAGDGAGDHNKTYKYVVTQVDASGDESLQSNAGTRNTGSLSGTHFNEISWTPAGSFDPDTEYYNIYKAESDISNIYGWIGESRTAAFRDYNLLPDITDTAPFANRDPFAGAGDYPGVVGYYQQRQIFGRTDNAIQTFFATQSGNFKSMRMSRPIKSDDAIERTIASKKVNEIRHFVELDSLIILTSGGEWRVTEGNDGVITPASVGFRRQSEYGAEHVPPLVVGNSALFVQAGGKTVRDLAYSFESDAYAGNDLSLHASHLFKNRTVKEWAYSQEPDGIAWTVMDDGEMLGFTFQKEHQVAGWHTHDTQGTFESVAVIPENNFDAVYVIVNRTINGGTKRYVERLKQRNWLVAEDAFIVDSGITYDGVAKTIIPELDHLEGEVVVALADGNVVLVDDSNVALTVTNGAITLPIAASKVQVGLAYVSDFETLDVDPNSSRGESLRGQPLNIGECVVKVKDSRGGYVGPDENNLNEMPSRNVDDSYDSVTLRTTEYRVSIEEDWSSNGRLFIRQTDPLPITILSVVPDIDAG